MPSAQSRESHTRWDPIFHFVIAPILLLNIVVMAWWYGKHFHESPLFGAWVVVVAIALLLLSAMVRSYSLKVQNRVIRLEEQARLASLLGSGEMAELSSLTVPQYVALRFASNPELPELARRAVRENLTSKQIKDHIKSWRADDYRV